MQSRKNPAAVQLGRLGGKAGTEAQNEARRQNGKKGGRPRKAALAMHAKRKEKLK